MVVADDEVDTLALGVGYLVDRLDATVQHDDQLYPILGGIVDAL